MHTKLEADPVYTGSAFFIFPKTVLFADSMLHHRLETTMNIYNNPADKFVASFIGSPTMNFINGVVAADGELMYQSVDKTLNLLIPDNHRNKFTPYANTEIILGIRPEHIHSQDQPVGSSMASVDGQIEVIETVGNEMFVYFTMHGGNSKEPLVARIPLDS